MGKLRYFFSYARKDSEFVLKLATELRAVGVNLWLDQLDILGGQRWDRAVPEALETCEGMIVVLSPASVASDNVMDEVSYALEKSPEKGNLVVPIVHQPCEIPFRLRRIQRIDFTVSYDTGFSQLLRALHVEHFSRKRNLEVLYGRVSERDLAFLRAASQPYPLRPIETDKRSLAWAPPGETWSAEPNNAESRTQKLINFGLLGWRGSEVATTELGQALIKLDDGKKSRRTA